jgi:hypothetical protein
MSDIDHFKKVNDEYGHLAGDFVLKMLASSITQKNIRKEECFARYGGEEFAIVLPDTTVDRAIILAAAMMRLVGVGRAAPGYPPPRAPLEVAAASAVFCAALGAVKPPRDLDSVLAHPRAGMLRTAKAEAAVRDAHYSLPRRLWWALLYRLGQS